jgi:anti-anti-sigma factor
VVEPESLLYHDGMVHLYRTFRPPGVRVVGEVDMSNAEAFGDALETGRRNGDLTVDLTLCDHLGSPGIGALIEVWQRLEGEIDLRIVGATPTVRYALEVSGIDRFAGIRLIDPDGGQEAG